MKEVWDSALKAVPADVIPLLLLLAAAFFGTYYFKGYRNYTDTLNDRWFLSAAVLIAAFSAIYWIQKPRSTPVERGTTVALLVPRFEDDEGRQVEKLFAQQVQAAVHALQPRAVVVQTDSYVRDRETATLTVKASDALAIVFQPRVIRLRDRILICFSLLLRDTETTRPFPPVAAELEQATLLELSSMLVTSLDAMQNQPRQDLLLARLQAIEQRMDHMNAALLRMAAAERPGAAGTYETKRAIVVGINEYQARQLQRLEGAVPDARSMADTLERAGFEVTLLLDRDATASRIAGALDRVAATARDRDMLLFHYSGMSFRSTDVAPASAAKDLILPPHDFSFTAAQDGATLSGLVARARRIRGDTLIILDGCHGTFGMSEGTPVPGGASGTLQILSGTQDDESGADTPMGGVFTQALLKFLATTGAGRPFSTSEILSGIMPAMSQASRNSQHPKLVTLAGTRDVTLAGPPGRQTREDR